MIDVSIIVPTMNRAAALRVALDSLIGQDFPKERFEVIVVDNGSTDNTRTVAGECLSHNPDVDLRYVFEPIPGLLSGRHRGAQEARGDLLCFVDDDIEATPTWLSAVVDAFTDEAVHLVGGPSLPQFETEPPAWMDRFMDVRDDRIICGDLSLFDIGDSTVNIDPTYVWGLNFSIRKQTLLDLGGFHPDCIPKELQLFQGDGETGLALKLRRSKFGTVYSPAAKVYHHIPRERLTVKYFENRNFYQGVCDSYTQIREKGGADSISPPVYKNEPHRLDAASQYEHYRQIIYGRIAKAYVDGFRFHYRAVKEDPRLLSWVLKENYFDYRLPDLSLGKGLCRSKLRCPVKKNAPVAPANCRKPDMHNSGADNFQYSTDEYTLSPKIVWQIETFKNSPKEERQSYKERTNAPLKNLRYFSELKNRLKVAGVPVREEKINRQEFDHWRHNVPRMVSFYRPAGDVFIEKCLEHYLVFKYLNLSAGDTYIDVAASDSPWAEVLNDQHIRSYQLDINYRKGIHGLRIGADAADSGLPDQFCSSLSLQCAFECFMGDADVRFVREASRLLAPGGRFAIVPLYLESDYFITTSPLIDQDQVIIDPGANRVWRDDKYVEAFSRMYSPEVFKKRIYSQLPPDIWVEVLYFENLEEILNYYVGQRIYCFFMLLGHKSGEPA